MFNVGSAELAIIAVAALLILGPKRLPELARSVGKFMREFRRQTDEVRNVVEREFYRMDEELSLDATKPVEGAAPNILPAEGAQPTNETLPSGEPQSTESVHSVEPVLEEQPSAPVEHAQPAEPAEPAVARAAVSVAAPVDHQADDATVAKKEIA
jgi:sec-independent protein translocase protein TatB